MTASPVPGSLVPAHIWHASTVEKVQYFKDCIVEHPKLMRALDEADEICSPLLERPLVLIIGGTGVGKTALLIKLVDRRNAKRRAASPPEWQQIAAVRVDAVPPDKGAFDFTSLFTASMEQMHCPLVERSFPSAQRDAFGRVVSTAEIVRASNRRPVPAVIRKRFIDEVIARAMELWAIDEGRHMFITGKAKSQKASALDLENQTNRLKSLAIDMSCTLAIAGAYDFLEMTVASGQITRRSRIVHLEPYDVKENSDAAGFAVAVAGMLQHLPVVHQLSAAEVLSLMVNSLGCVGTAKGILMEALSKALHRCTPLSSALLYSSFYADVQRAKMRYELEIGRRQLRQMTSMTNGDAAIDGLLASSRRKAPSPTKPALKPGETTPSHRKQPSAQY